MKLLAIDGNSVINRAFYGIKLLSTKDGQYTNGIYGFINILNRLCEIEQPDGIAVAFDLRAPTFRHAEYAEYKAGRKGMPDELASQLPILKQWLELMGYRCLECEGYEADDILGTLADICRDTGGECVIATGDRDSLQLISDTTRVLLTATKMGRPELTNYDKAALFERYGLTPEEMIELKALMGDSSDNIPGVAGIGEKTAADLISRYHNIDYIYEHLDELEIKEGVRAKLAAGRENAFLSRRLGTICRTVPISRELSDYLPGERDTAALTELMTKLEFFKLLEKMDLKPSQAFASEENREEKVVFEFEMPEFCEGTAFLYLAEEGFAVCADKKVFRLDENAAKRLLENPAVQKFVYDSKAVFKRFPEAQNIVFDTMLAGYVCNPSSSSYSLERLAGEYGALHHEIKGCDDLLCINAALLWAVCPKLKIALEKSGQHELFENIELPLAKVLAEMERAGFLVDCEGLKRQSEELSERIKLIESEIYSLVGYEFNLNSPKQLGTALFEKLQLPARKKTKSGYSTNAEVLESLKYAHPAVEKLLEYRQLAKLKSTYCDGLQACVGEDGRIHTTFNQTEARTGRISSLDPNLQNIPVRTEEGRKIRGHFTVPQGYMLCDADYSQIELRVLAAMSGDKNMAEAFNTGVDIHTVTASQVFGMPVEMVTPLLRTRAKAVNFGIIYGIGAFSLSKDLGVSRSDADNYIKGYLAAYPAVGEYMEKTINEAKKNGYVTTLFGRRRYLPELSSSNRQLREFGERVARNAPIQGTAADIIKIAMIRVSKRLKEELPDAKLILQVHDELIVECPETDADTACRILKEEMENAVDMSVKMSVDVHTGKNWLEAKE